LKTSSKNRHDKTRKVENVLVLQGGGSLGAFACGVYKTLAKHELKFDIITGTSIGAINGAIIAGSKNNNPEKDLENFWLDLAKSSKKIFPSDPLNAWTYGVTRFFLPRWHWRYMQTDPEFFAKQRGDVDAQNAAVAKVALERVDDPDAPAYDVGLVQPELDSLGLDVFDRDLAALGILERHVTFRAIPRHQLHQAEDNERNQYQRDAGERGASCGKLNKMKHVRFCVPQTSRP